MEPEAAADPVDGDIDAQGGVIGPVPDMGEPLGIHHHHVELIAMDDEISLAGSGGMDGAIDKLDLAEIGAEIFAQEFVVIAG
ncbi:hypothetical protein D3C72_2190760 [compost metagenome]